VNRAEANGAAVPLRRLNDGRSIPAIGLGTFGMTGEAGIEAVASGLRAGYRLLDTALRYENESEVAEGIRRSGVPREEVLVSTKLRGRDHGFAQTLDGFSESLSNLGLDYVDLYLIHWPLPRIDRYVESWTAMIELRDRGLVRSIGVSNFRPEHIDRLIEETGVTPAVNQIELHPHFPQQEQLASDSSRGIVTQSWSPLADQRSRLAEHPVVTAVAAAHGVTGTQAVLRWHIQRGAVPIPKSADPGRQRENLGVFDFDLSEAEVAAISALESGRLWSADPLSHEEF
jgi:2,5-diketo-D-gluconate reductase A